MAMANIKAVMLLNFTVLLSLLLIISAAEGRLFGIGFGNIGIPLSCQSVHGVESGETCFTIGRQFNLTDTGFGAINPNLDCSKLFIGQWLCVRGAV